MPPGLLRWDAVAMGVANGGRHNTLAHKTRCWGTKNTPCLPLDTMWYSRTLQEAGGKGRPHYPRHPLCLERTFPEYLWSFLALENIL